jgi:predicted dehydrogenase
MTALVLGAGAAGLLHALAYRAHGVRVAAIFDPDARRARDLADLCGAEVAPSLEALAGSDAEFASVCSPPAAHVAQAALLARSGRTVFVEKPVAVSRGELRRLAALPGCVPVVQWRAGRGLRAVRRAIARGELGDAPVVSCDLAWSRDEAYVRARGASWGCGAVLSVGIHAIDALLWALDRTVEDARGVTTRREGAWAETGAVGHLRFEGGALATLRISLDGGADTTRLTFCGRGVTAVLEGGEADPTATAVRWSAADLADGPRADERVAALARLERETSGALGSPLLVPYLGGAIRAAREGRSPGDTERLPSMADVVEAHATALGLARDARAGQPAAGSGSVAMGTSGSMRYPSSRVTRASPSPRRRMRRMVV